MTTKCISWVQFYYLLQFIAMPHCTLILYFSSALLLYFFNSCHSIFTFNLLRNFFVLLWLQDQFNQNFVPFYLCTLLYLFVSSSTIYVHFIICTLIYLHTTYCETSSYSFTINSANWSCSIHGQFSYGESCMKCSIPWDIFLLLCYRLMIGLW